MGFGGNNGMPGGGGGGGGGLGGGGGGGRGKRRKGKRNRCNRKRVGGAAVPPMSGGNRQPIPIASMRMRMDDYRPPRAGRLLGDPKDG